MSVADEPGTASILAEVACPRCKELAARLVFHGGELLLHYQAIGLVDRPEHPVLSFSWDSIVLPRERQKIPFGCWQTRCADAACMTSFVLEAKRLIQLAGHVRKCGWPVRWTPEALDMERSDKLRPLFEWRFAGPDPKVPETRRVQLSSPPPLTNDNVRPLPPRSLIQARIRLERQSNPISDLIE